MSTCKITYIGRRIFNEDKGQIAHTFLDGKFERYFIGNYNLEIGVQYKAQRKGKNISITKWPEVLGRADAVTEEMVKAWEKQDYLAVVFKRRVSEGKKAQRKAETFAKENSAFRHILRGMGYLQKRQFIEFLIDEIERLENAKRK